MKYSLWATVALLCGVAQSPRKVSTLLQQQLTNYFIKTPLRLNTKCNRGYLLTQIGSRVQSSMVEPRATNVTKIWVGESTTSYRTRKWYSICSNRFRANLRPSMVRATVHP